MLQILLLLIVLAIVFALAFLLIDKWDHFKNQVISRLIIIVLLFGSTAFGLRHWIISSVGCVPNCVGDILVSRNLSGMRLQDAMFVDANMANAKFTGANLMNADFSGANLLAANFEGTNLRNAKFVGANLKRANFAGADLAGANLNGADLDGADLTGLDLRETTLLGVNMMGVELESADLRSVELVAADLVDAKLNGAKLSNANIAGANLSRADLSGTNLSGSNLSGAWLNLTMLAGADLSNAELLGVSLIGADLASANLSGSRLVGSTLIAADLSGSNLNGANLLGSRLLLSELTDADLVSDRTLEELNELQLSLMLADAKLEGATFNGQTVWPNRDVSEEMVVTSTTEEEDEIDISNAIKIGILHSLSGPMANSESAVRDATLLAIDEINEAGGVLERPLLVTIEDGSSDPEVFAQKARKLIVDDEVVAIFGSWTSDSRKAILPVVEELNSLLFYPVQYEGFEESSNIFYLGAEPTQQIIPAAQFLVNEGHERIFLIGSDFVLPQITHAILKAFLADSGATVTGDVLMPLGETDFSNILMQLSSSPPDAIFSTLGGDSSAAFFQQLAEEGFTSDRLPVMSVSVAEEEVRLIGADVLLGHLTTWNYYQTVESTDNFAFVTAYKNTYGDDRVTSDPIEAGYFAVYLWKQLVELAGSTETDALLAVAASREIELMAPGGLVKLDGETRHLYKTARVGTIREDGLIETIVASEEPVKPDPFLTQYEWAEELSVIISSIQEGQ